MDNTNIITQEYQNNRISLNNNIGMVQGIIIWNHLRAQILRKIRNYQKKDQNQKILRIKIIAIIGQIQHNHHILLMHIIILMNIQLPHNFNLQSDTKILIQIPKNFLVIFSSNMYNNH